MRFGIFFEHQLPRPWEERSEQTIMEESLEQTELADRLGLEYVWAVEHHFLEEYSHCSAPELFLAAASQRTTDIRLGHGIMQTIPAYNHPARNAERLATLDLLSGGRVEFGSGESSSVAELGGFGIDPDTKRAAWKEGLEATVRCMTEAPFGGIEGTYVSMPPRNVVPKPVQKPHPPLWVACSRRDTILLAAELGLGALTFAFVDPEEADHWVSDHDQVLAERCLPIGETVNTDIACVTSMMCHPDAHEALERGMEGGNFFGYSLAHYYVFGEHTPAATDVWQQFLDQRAERGYDPEVQIALEQETLGAKIAAGETSGLRGAIGTPDQLRGYLRRYEEAGVDQLIFVMQAGNNRHEHIMESLELFGAEVLPEFKDRDEAQRSAKATRLAPVVEAALDRREKHLAEHPYPTMADDYVMEAYPRQLLASTYGEEVVEYVASESSVGNFDTFREANRGTLGGD